MSKVDSLFNDLKDIIKVLRDKDRFKDENFRNLWKEKARKVKSGLMSLSPSEFEEMEKKYERWCKKKFS